MFAVSSEPRMNHKAKQWKWIENNEHRPRESSSTRGNADEHVEQNIASFVLEHDEQTYCNNTLDKENASANRSHDTNKISGSRQHPHKLSSDHGYSAKNEANEGNTKNKKNTPTYITQMWNTLKQQGTGRIYKQHHCLVLYKQTLRSIHGLPKFVHSSKLLCSKAARDDLSNARTKAACFELQYWKLNRKHESLGPFKLTSKAFCAICGVWVFAHHLPECMLQQQPSRKHNNDKKYNSITHTQCNCWGARRAWCLRGGWRLRSGGETTSVALFKGTNCKKDANRICNDVKKDISSEHTSVQPRKQSI